MNSIWLQSLSVTILSPGGPGGLWGYFPYLLKRFVPEVIPWKSIRLLSNLSDTTTKVTGAALITTGVSLYLSVAWLFASKGDGTPAPYIPPKRLVQDGLFGIIRHPNYQANLFVILGEAFLFKSTNIMFYGAFVWLSTFIYVKTSEEPHLRQQYGEDYKRYEKEVAGWIPGIY